MNPGFALARVVQEVSIRAQPLACLFVVGAGVRDKAPEMARVIEAPQMHQLVDQHVFADRVGHQDQTPVEADMTGRRAGSPARPLVPYADARHPEPMICREAQQLGRQLARGLPSQLRKSLGRVRLGARAGILNPRALPLNPGALLLGKQLGVPAGSPSRKGDTDASVRPDTYHVSSCPGMADEFHETITIVLRHGS